MVMDSLCLTRTAILVTRGISIQQYRNDNRLVLPQLRYFHRRQLVFISLQGHRVILWMILFLSLVVEAMEGS